MDRSLLRFMGRELPREVENLVERGHLREAEVAIEKLLKSAIDRELRLRLLFEADRLKRWRHEYPYSEEEALGILREHIPDITGEELRLLLERGCVDHRVIDGETRIFRRFVPNLFWLCPRRGVKRTNDKKENEAREELKKRVQKIMEEARRIDGGYVAPVLYRVKMSIRVHPGVIPVGETARIWIPLPRVDEIHPHVKIIAHSRTLKKIASEAHPQRTAYFEVEASEGGASAWIEYEYVSRGFYAKLGPGKVGQQEEDSMYGIYTCERVPHVVFTPYLRRLAEEISGGETNPHLLALRVWKWITRNVRYTYAHDYALYDNIAEYVARNRRGDCGMQSILFITLCRILGIPARWQSGWYMNPVRPGMHDWAQFYVKPYGWLYADPSFGSLRHREGWRNEFYFGGIEGYRLASNIEFSVEFDPPKYWFRSDPVDNQRGEVEWRGGNVYYDGWDYKLELLDFRSLDHEDPPATSETFGA